jgi:DNA repair exonuclease SbcCD ATPase subunit
MRRIDTVEISQIKGIPAATFKPGTLTVVKGENGSGKSSILDAIRTVFDGGHDPGLVSLGAKSGFVKLTLDDGTTIRKGITAKGTTLEIKALDGKVVAKPQQFVEQLASGFAFDPIAFLHASKKEQIQYLLKAMPIEFTSEELSLATGVHHGGGTCPLAHVDQLRKELYDERRSVNVSLSDAESTVKTFREQLPPDDGTNWPAEVRRLRERKFQLAAETETVRALIDAETQEYRSAIASELAKAITAAELEGVQAVAKVLEKRDSIIATARALAQEKGDSIRSAVQVAIDEKTTLSNAELVALEGQLKQAEERANAQRRASTLHEHIASFSKRATAYAEKSYKLNAAIAALDELKRRKLAETPIPGITIEDGTVFVDGVELRHVNLQKQFMVAFMLASLRPGGLGFVIADNSEAIVGEAWEEFKAAAEECGLQLMLARAEAGAPLSIETGGVEMPLRTGKE